jgi:hypothetical protein
LLPGCTHLASHLAAHSQISAPVSALPHTLSYPPFPCPPARVSALAAAPPSSQPSLLWRPPLPGHSCLSSHLHSQPHLFVPACLPACPSPSFSCSRPHTHLSLSRSHPTTSVFCACTPHTPSSTKWHETCKCDQGITRAAASLGSCQALGTFGILVSLGQPTSLALPRNALPSLGLALQGSPNKHQNICWF